MSWRDLGAGELRKEDVGRTVTVAGWTARATTADEVRGLLGIGSTGATASRE